MDEGDPPPLMEVEAYCSGGDALEEEEEIRDVFVDFAIDRTMTVDPEQLLTKKGRERDGYSSMDDSRPNTHPMVLFFGAKRVIGFEFACDAPNPLIIIFCSILYVILHCTSARHQCRLGRDSC